MNFEIQSAFKKSNYQNWILAISAILFTLLFHKTELGLNLAIFDILVFLFWLAIHPGRFKEPLVIVSASALLISALCTAWYGTPETILWSIICIMIISQQMVYPENSILFSETKSFINLFMAPINAVTTYLEQNQELNKGQKFLKGLIVIGIPLVFAFIFASLYQNLNPTFEKAYSSFINLLDLSIVITITLGLYFSLVIFKTFIPEKLSWLDQHFGNSFANRENKPSKHSSLEMQTGLALFGIVNLVLLVFLISDIRFVGQLQIGQSDDYSRYVHEGIGVVIFSILIATSFILFFFRDKEFSQMSNQHWLKRLALLWVILNIVILITTGLKNGMYVMSYGLTLKRVGVFIYLLLAMSGLSFAFAKVYLGRTNAFLFRKLYWSFFIILTLNICVDWSTIITRFNIHENIKDHRQLDWDYLFSLGDRVLPTLDYYKKDLHLTKEDKAQFTERLHKKSIELKSYEPQWREMNISTAYAKSYFIK